MTDETLNATESPSSRDRRGFKLGFTLGLVGGGVLAPLILMACGAFSNDSRPVAPAPDHLEAACQSFYGSGGASGSVIAKQLDMAVKHSSWSADSFKEPFLSLKTGIAAASSVSGLSDSEFETFRSLAVATEKADFALTSGDEYAAVDSDLAAEFAGAMQATEDLCS